MSQPSSVTSSSLTWPAEGSDEPASAAPKSIGPYQLIEQVGAGGMGIVYRARQTSPVVREVALKLIKLGMDTRDVVQRFANEKQTLAMLDHPGIAKVFDAGASEMGRPYFVMELVADAEPVTQFCDRHQLDTRARLGLFIKVCSAVQHAHYKGIVHRDLKPSNVLVRADRDDGPSPKIIDFGIAKAIEQSSDRSGRANSATLLTQRLAGPVGTLAYMSPEQAAGSADIDTRSDVYSLGVILYELLTGTVPIEPPADLATRGSASWAQILTETNPPAPSTRVQSRARDVRGELDWITLKAMDADRARRYGSAHELADDIRRYLSHEPVSAVRPSRVYRARKFVRRNRVLVIATTCIAMSLCVGIVLTTWQMIRARRAEETAVRNQQRERAINSFLNDLIESSNPRAIGGGPSMSVKDLLYEALAKLDKSYDQDPAVEVPLRMTIGGAFRGMGYFDLAETQFRKAYELGKRALGETSYETLRAGDSLVAVLTDMNRPADAEPIARRTMDVLHAANRSTDRRAIVAAHRYANTQLALGRVDEGVQLLRKSLADHEQHIGADDPQTIDVTGSLGRALHRQGNLDEAEAMLRRAIDSYTRTVGPEHPVTLARLHFLGRVLQDRGDLAGAERVYRQSVEGFERVAPNVAQAQRVRERLARLLFSKGEYREAATLFRKSHEAWKHLNGPDDAEDTLRSGVQLVETLRALGETAQASQLSRELIAGYERVRPSDPMLALLRRWEAMPTTASSSVPSTIPTTSDER